MEDHISVLVTKKDFKTKSYMSNTDCPLAAALKRKGYKFGYESNFGAVGGDYVWFGADDRIVYGMLEWKDLAGMSELKNQDLMVNLLKI